MSSPPPDHFQLLTEAAKGMIFDVYLEAPLITDEVWNIAVPSALLDLSRFKPLRKRFDLVIVAGEDTVDLPADALSLDQIDLGRVLKPCGMQVVMRDQILALEWLTAASSSVISYRSVSPFAEGTTLQAIDDGAGSRQLWIDPPPSKSVTFKTLYHARHQVTAELNTLPADLRDLALQKICSHACRALATLTTGDEKLSARLSEIAANFNTEYENRTRFAPFGALG